MGCQVSSDGSQFEKSDYDKLWKRMNSVSEPHPNAPRNGKNQKKKKQRGWKILRILVVSTYKDFRNERRAVLDLIENKLQPIATEKQVILQVEDFSWGSKAHLEDASCLYLIERLCRESSSSPYFYLHFLGECAGYVIDHTFTDESFLRQHSISCEQSYSEVFLQLAGLQNPNSLFLYRNPSFHQELPFNVTNFIDSPANRERAKYLTSMVKGEVPSSKFIEYSVRTSGINNTHFKHILFDDLSGAIKPIENSLTKYLDNLTDIESTSIPTTDDFLKDFYSDTKVDQDIMTKVESNLRSRKSTLLVGEYCTGKTSILHRIQRKHGESVLVQIKEKMNAVELRRAIESKTKVILHDVEHKIVRYLLIDDLHLATKEAQQYLVGNEELVIIATSRKKKIDVEMDRITIPHLDPEGILDELSFWLNGGIKEKSGVPSVKASNILKTSQQKRRRSVGNVEDGHQPDENVGWNSLKCRVIGTLGRLGSSDEKCAQLSQLSTLSVVEADICLMESDGKGHLLIAALCFLTIIESGLNEMELRSLLILEYNLLPIGIRRNYRNLPFDYCPDEFGTTSCIQTPPLRWYFVLHRLSHILMRIDSDCNHFVLPSACKRVVFKKFLKHPHNMEHFKKHLKTFTTAFSSREWNRNRQIGQFIS